VYDTEGREDTNKQTKREKLMMNNVEMWRGGEPFETSNTHNVYIPFLCMYV
jgi:hypothetical protein